MMLGILAILWCFVLLVIAMWVSYMYEIHVPVEPRTDIEKKCIDIKERLRWLNWKLQEQKSKEENSF